MVSRWSLCNLPSSPFASLAIMIVLVFPTSLAYSKFICTLEERLLLHTTIRNETHSLDAICFESDDTLYFLLCKVIQDCEPVTLLAFIESFKAHYDIASFGFLLFGTCGSHDASIPIGAAYYVNTAYNLIGSIVDGPANDIPSFKFQPDPLKERKVETSICNPDGVSICSSPFPASIGKEGVPLYDDVTYPFFRVVTWYDVKLLGAIQVVINDHERDHEQEDEEISFLGGVVKLTHLLDADRAAFPAQMTEEAQLTYIDIIQRINDPTTLASMTHLISGYKANER